MTTQKITSDEIKDLRIASLPSRPTAPLSFGGRGYSARQMKEAFDRLPLLIIERLNSLIDEICTEGEGSVTASIQTGIGEGYSLQNLCDDIASSEIFRYMAYGDGSFADFLEQLCSDVDKLKEESLIKESEK